MIYSLRGLLISFGLMALVVLLIVLRTFSTLRSQEEEQRKIDQCRHALQVLGPAIINMHDLASFPPGPGDDLATSRLEAAKQRVRSDSAQISVFAASDPRYAGLQAMAGDMLSGQADSAGAAGKTTLLSRFKAVAGQLEEENRLGLNASYAASLDLTRRSFLFARLLAGLLLLILITSFWLVSTDMKARRKNQEKLQQFNSELEKQVREQTRLIRQNEAKYKPLFESMTDAYAKTGMDGRVIDFNPSFRDMIGYQDEEIYNLHYSDITPERWHETEAGIIQKQVRRLGYSEVYEKEYRHKSGRVFPVELRTFLIRDEAGEPAAFWAIVRDISERKEAEAKLEAYSRNLRYALSSTTDVFYVTDAECRITLFNEVASRNLRIHWKKDLRVGASVLDLVPPEKYADTRQRFERAMQGERIEYEVRQEDEGLPEWVLVTFTPITDEAGQVLGATVQGKDISERKAAEEMLKRSEQQLLASIENTPNVAVQWYNEKGEVLFWNNASELIFGWTSTEANGRTLRRLIFDDVEHGRFLTMLGEVARTSIKIGPVEFTFRRKEGRPGCCLSTIFSIPAVDGNLRFACMDVDITNQKRVEFELREAESKFRNLVEQSVVGVYIVQDERFVYANPFLEALAGYGPGEMNGLSVFEVFFPDDMDTIRENLRLRIEGETQSMHYEAKGRRRDGSLIYVELLGSRTEFNGRPAIIGTILDITGRKQTEKEKDRVRYLLNERVKELSALYRVSQAFQREKQSEAELFDEIVKILPSGWQFDSIAAARIILGDTEYKTPNWGRAFHRQASSFPAPGGKTGTIEVIYLQQRRQESEDAFLAEERNLINMVAEMLRINLARRHEAEMNRRMEQEIMSRKIQEQKIVTRAVLNAEERERNKIGRELHDNVNQILASVKLFLSVALKESSPGQMESLRRCVEMLEHAIAEIRTLSQNQVTPVRDIDLRESLETLIDRLNFSTSIKTDFSFENSREIDDEITLNAYRIIQEQVSNILKHANASRVTIRVYTDEQFLHLFVSDNGRGFDVNERRKGIGVSNMINRVESFNGEFEIDSRPGEGCRIKIKLPLSPV